ncbi:MAG TPA: ATP-binding cassette domain-containing protein [Acidobacteriota bacterium]|nr:ATP-binding cassette domain-containing protein [Acidobacteriota bacterium]
MAETGASNHTMIELRNVNYSVGDFHILTNISLQVLAGTTMMICGVSGAGKSTILKLILGLIKPDSGEIFVDGEEISRYTESQLMPVRHKLGMVFQESALFDSLTVRENVGYVLYERAEMSEEEIDNRVLELLTLVELEEMMDKMPAELSGGQKRRVAIARAMAASPSIILYDEPTAGLDPVTSNTIVKQMMKLRDIFSVTSILVSHKLEDGFKMAFHVILRDQEGLHMEKDASGRRLAETRFYMIREGELIFEGTAQEFKNHPDPYIQEFQH